MALLPFFASILKKSYLTYDFFPKPTSPIMDGAIRTAAEAKN